MSLTLGSLFDGIGGFPLAGTRWGFRPVWASEIEKFPIEVTRAHFPQMHHVGDITKLKGEKLTPVDVVCGGSPCQDLSVANGRRLGLQGERSGLFMEQVRVIKEMRAYDKANGRADESVRPRYMVWENVPGAFSSSGSEDFRAVLEETCRIADGTVFIPRPPGGVWKSAGAILGDQFSVAWRVYDAQYWPRTPQRRKRIYLVADFGGRNAPQILFEQDRLPGNPAAGKEARQRASPGSQTGTGDSGGQRTAPGGDTGQCLISQDINNSCVYEESSAENGGEISAFHINQRNEVIDLEDVSGALLATRNMQMQTFIAEPLICFNDQGGKRMDIAGEAAPTLRADMRGHPPLVAQTDDRMPEQEYQQFLLGSQPELFENHGIDARYTGPHPVAPTMSARYGTGGNNVPLISQFSVFPTDLSEPLVPSESYCISGNIIDRRNHNGGNGLGIQPDISYTVTATDRHCVFSQQRSDEYEQNKVASTQSARQYKDATDLVCETDVAGLDCRNGTENGDLSGTLQSKANGGYSLNNVHPIRVGKLIRRLTPLECERLQGYPDHWTDIPGASDSARYKALGNSVAIPCVEHVLRGIAYFLHKFKSEEESACTSTRIT